MESPGFRVIPTFPSIQLLFLDFKTSTLPSLIESTVRGVGLVVLGTSATEPVIGNVGEGTSEGVGDGTFEGFGAQPINAVSRIRDDIRISVSLF